MARCSSLLCAADLLLVGPKTIPLSVLSLLKRRLGDQPTNIEESCKSDG